MNDSRARSSAANDEAAVAEIQVEGELPDFPDVDRMSGTRDSRLTATVTATSATNG